MQKGSGVSKGEPSRKGKELGKYEHEWSPEKLCAQSLAFEWGAKFKLNAFECEQNQAET